MSYLDNLPVYNDNIFTSPRLRSRTIIPNRCKHFNYSYIVGMGTLSANSSGSLQPSSNNASLSANTNIITSKPAGKLLLYQIQTYVNLISLLVIQTSPHITLDNYREKREIPSQSTGGNPSKSTGQFGIKRKQESIQTPTTAQTSSTNNPFANKKPLLNKPSIFRR